MIHRGKGWVVSQQKAEGAGGAKPNRMTSNLGQAVMFTNAGVRHQSAPAIRPAVGM